MKAIVKTCDNQAKMAQARMKCSSTRRKPWLSLGILTLLSTGPLSPLRGASPIGVSAGGHYITVFPAHRLVIVQNPGPYQKGDGSERANPELLRLILNALEAQ